MTEKNINKIIVVDDEVVIALRLQERLTTMGYEVIDIAHTGEEAVEKVRKLRPDLMLLDIMIPGKLDGIQVAETVKSELDIPVIFITAFSEDQIIERAKQAEPYGYIVKPFQDRELKAAIAIALYKKEMERRLRESEGKYRQLFATVSDAFMVFDAETREFLDANDAVSSLYGYSKEEFLELKHTDITAEPEKSDESIRQTVAGEISSIPIRYHKKKDGTKFPVEISSGAFKLRDRQILCGVVRDITERKQTEEALRESEKRYRAVVESQAEMICRFLPDGTLTFVNEAYCRYFDKGREELIGHKFMPLIPESDQGKVLENIVSLNPNTPVITLEHRVFAPNGEICWHKWTNRAIFDYKSNLVEYQAVGWDITNRVQVEESLQKAHDELEQRVEERTKDLEIKTTRLEEVNAAMKVLLEHSEMYKKELEEKVLSNIKELVDPYLEKLEGSGSDAKKIYLSIIKSNIDDIISPFTQKLSSKYLNLTPSEIRIANLVKQGKTTKEMAGILNISGKTVGFHRENIRKKLGLKNKKANLRSHLISLQ